MSRLLIALVILAPTSLLADEDGEVVADVAQYQCVFQHLVKDKAKEKAETRLAVGNAGCSVSDELQIGTIFAMAQGCVSPQKKDITLLVYPETPAPRATGVSDDLIVRAETTLQTSTDDKYILSCDKK